MSERLTWRTSAGTPNFNMTEAIRKDNIARSAFYQKACDRLAAYEDSGLKPEEILQMKSLCQQTYDELRHNAGMAGEAG